MVSLKGVAFALGGIGLALFLAAMLWAFVFAVPDCGRETCPNWDASKATANVMFLAIGAVVLESLAVVFLVLHLRSGRKPQPAPPGKPTARPNGGTQRPRGPVVSVARKDRDR